MAIMNITQTKKFLLHSPIDIAVLINGNHGIGKSAIVKQVAKLLGIPCIDFRLAQNDVGDLKGIPYMVNGRTVFAPPEFFPLREADALELKDLLNLTENISLGKYGDRGILFLDEINRANREVQQAAFELVLDRRLNLRSLPDGWRVVSAINGDDSIYSVNSMEPAFLSRFALIDLKPTFEEWFVWADNEGQIHTAITQFIRQNNDFLDPSEDMLKKSSLKGVQKVHDRRAWEMFSKTLKKYENDFDNKMLSNHPLEKTQEVYAELISLAGCFVGQSAALKFQEFIDQDYNTLNGDMILNHLTKEIKDHIKNICENPKIKNKTTILSGYNVTLVSYIKNTLAKNLSSKQKENLSTYLEMLPANQIATFWDLALHEIEKIALDWYTYDIKTTKRNSMIITRSVADPRTLN